MAVRVHLKALETVYTADCGTVPQETVITVESATHYVTQATGGAGLICDVYDSRLSPGAVTKYPVATFANVLYAEIVPELEPGPALTLGRDELAAVHKCAELAVSGYRRDKKFINPLLESGISKMEGQLVKAGKYDPELGRPQVVRQLPGLKGANSAPEGG